MKFSASAPVKIIVIGAGGTGGYAIPQIYKIACVTDRECRIIICDGDIVEEKNLIRQNFIADDIGKNKAQVLAERYSAAYGMECEYIPEYIESEHALLTLCYPDFVKQPYSYPPIPESQKVILVGCVDNNRSRQICHKVFSKINNLIYIDSGNESENGQVVCGVKQSGRTTYKPVGSVYPDILNDEDKLPTELSCAERAVSAPQSITANLMAAMFIVCYLYNLLMKGEIATRYVTFSSRLMNARAEVVKKRKRRKKEVKNIETKSTECHIQQGCAQKKRK